MLCAVAADMTAQLRTTLWNQERPAILTSATLAAGKDFLHFKEETGLLADGRVTESVSPSPFNYKANCLLYLPLHPPEQADGSYFDELAAEIAALADASWGHALVLFTSYAAMSAVKERLTDMSLPQTLFTMGRNAVHTTQQFKDSPGSVLLATGDPAKPPLRLCGERRSKGANAVFAAGGNGVERTLRRRGRASTSQATVCPCW